LGFQLFWTGITGGIFQKTPGQLSPGPPQKSIERRGRKAVPNGSYNEHEDLGKKHSKLACVGRMVGSRLAKLPNPISFRGHLYLYSVRGRPGALGIPF